MIDEVAFQNLEVRLADRLIDRAEGEDTVHTKQTKNSVELGMVEVN